LPLKDFYATLNSIKHDNSALWGNDVKFLSSEDNLLVFQRGNLKCIFNFNDGEKEYTAQGKFVDIFTGKSVEMPVKVAGKGYVILKEE
jgi:hypothetical protein